jgi:hypothetical protein
MSQRDYILLKNNSPIDDLGKIAILVNLKLNFQG